MWEPKRCSGRQGFMLELSMSQFPVFFILRKSLYLRYNWGSGRRKREGRQGRGKPRDGCSTTSPHTGAGPSSRDQGLEARPFCMATRTHHWVHHCQALEDVHFKAHWHLREKKPSIISAAKECRDKTEILVPNSQHFLTVPLLGSHMTSLVFIFVCIYFTEWDTEDIHRKTARASEQCLATAYGRTGDGYVRCHLKVKRKELWHKWLLHILLIFGEKGGRDWERHIPAARLRHYEHDPTAQHLPIRNLFLE